jgi:thioesterase domain-containing protein/acyl carrier protein
MIPSSFLWLETLPLSPNGKIDRRALPVPTKLEDEKNNIFLAPRDDLERQLSSIWADILERSTVGIQDNFFDLGGHSLLAVKLMAQIQNTFGQSLSIASLFQSPTVESLAALLRNSATVVSWSPLVNIQAQGSKTPFFCVPGAGGNALYLYHLARSLDPERPFYGLQAQGLDGKSAPIMDMETIAQSYVQAIQQIQPQGPYLLGGHSFGGWVAFAMAQQLQRQGHSVGLVAVIDTQAPASVTPTTSINIDQDEAQWLEDLGSLIERAYDVHLGLDHAELVTLDVEQQLDYFNLKLQSIGILPPESDVSLVRGLVNVFQAHHYITYSPQNVHPVPIVLFKAQDHSLEDLSGGEEDILNQPDWGWERLAQNTLEIYSVPGDHMTILSQSHVGILATQLKACLDKAENLGH